MNDVQIRRQALHWIAAIERLGDFSFLGSDQPWEALELHTTVSIRQSLIASQRRLLAQARKLYAHLDNKALTTNQANQMLEQLKHRYLRTETMFDFYGDAINSRSGDRLSHLLRACDIIASKSMQKLLVPLGYEVPPVVTYIDKGLGAAILKAGLRLWDQSTDNPVAMIKVVRHNLLRPTSLIHEAGHQVAHILDWNEELRQVLNKHLVGTSTILAEMWSGWASEIAADVYAFVHAGYGSIASLHDVVSGSSRQVFRFVPGDPHPISFLRVLLGEAFCQISFGAGPWNHLRDQWRNEHRLDRADREVRELMSHSIPLLVKIARICLQNPYETLGGQSLISRIPLDRIHPRRMNTQYSPNLFADDRWILRQDPLDLLALSSWKIGVYPTEQNQFEQYQNQWMHKIGAYRVALF